MSDTTLWLDAFPRDWDAAHERRVPGRAAEVVYYPGARRDGGSDGLWLRIAPAHGDSWTGVFSSEFVPGRLSAFDAEGLAWESEHLGPDAVWLGRLDDEVHLRAGDVLHRVQLRHGRTVSEPAPW